MKAVVSTLAILLCGLFRPDATAQEPTDLLALRDAYQENIEERSQTLRDRFSASLERLEKTLASRSQLEEALSVREKRTAHSESRDFAASADIGLALPDYLRLAETYNRNLETIVRPLRATYINALEAMEKKFVDKGELKFALAVKAERERLDGERDTPSTAVSRPPGAPKSASELTELLTYSVWEYRDGGSFKAKPGYLFLHEEGKSFLGSNAGKWSALTGSEVGLSLGSSSRNNLKLTFSGDSKSFTATAARAKTPTGQGKLLSKE